jgi:hypothetical protein
VDATKVKSQPPVNSLTSTARADATQQAKKRADQQTQAPEVKKAAEPQPRPNVNGEGKMIGTRLSVTA